MLNLENADPSFLETINLDEVNGWLAAHPKARVTIGAWNVLIESPLFADVDHEAYDKPFEWDGTTEDFTKTESNVDGEWYCEWQVC